MAIRFTNALEDSFGPLSKTLLFEYPTLQSVTEYFLHSYPEQLRSLLRIEESSGASPIPMVSDHRLHAGRTPHGLTFLHKEAVGMQTGTAPVPTDVFVANGHTQEDKAGAYGREPWIVSAPPQGDIAIVGVAGRYPGARDLRAFWENLCEGRDCITEIPPERWDHRLYFDADKNKPGKTYCKWGGFLEGVDEFDPLFFNISPREAEKMDPQERLFLECAFATLEDAGYTREELSVYQGNGLAGPVTAGWMM